MTQRQNTNNPCPSNALADLNDNTIIIDEFVNSKKDYTTDRFGNQLQTKHKILNDFRNAVDRIQRGSFLPISSVHTNENGVPTYMIGDLVDFKSRPTVNDSFVTTTDQFVNKFEQFGFQKFPSGLIIQWGLTEYFSTSQEAGTIQPFYITFPTVCVLILTSDGYSGVHSTSASAISNSQFRCWGRDQYGNYGDTRMFYMAIGF